ncbi:hypothetical protein scyTo_0024348 [Scyliorhinus torazame]|uniref:Uncharacterized protein n=1 Tax=Scyliorhinus torazame TaxID=75743 RepID=A0A401QDR5_SCYTO|nr:hypothetical protein [Scyliorhinus torazame]
MNQEADYEKYGSSFTETAVPPFVKSLSSLLILLKIALQVGFRDLMDTDISKFQEEVQIANREAEDSVKCADGLGALIDGNSEKLTAEYGQVTSRRKELASSLQNNQNKLRSLEMERELLQDRLQTAKASLRQVEDSLREAKAKSAEKQTGRDVGIGLSFLLPCVGIPMAVAFEKERRYRKSEVDVTTDDRLTLKSNITKDEEQLSQINSQVPELHNEINEVNGSLEENKGVEQSLKERRVELAHLQSRMRNCCQYLSTFQGKVSALKVQSQHMYNMSPLLPFLEEAGLQAQQVPDTEQLFNQVQVYRLIGDLKAMLPKIKVLLLSEDSAGDYMK